MRADLLLLALSLPLAAGCNSSLATADYTCTAPVTLATVQAQVFSQCGASCHLGSPPSAKLDLHDGAAWSHLVHVESSSSPTKFLVEPGDPDHSFLWQKLVDQIDPAGSEGVPMPRDASDQWAPLTHDQLLAVRCWISAGAAP